MSPAHRVAGLAVDGAMTGPRQRSAISEGSSQHPDDMLGFEFIPNGTLTAIRVDAVVVPSGAQCASRASEASSAARRP